MEKKCAQHLELHKDFFKKSGLKLTSIRLRVLDIFEHAKKPLSVKEVYSMLGMKNADLVTVYRNVETLKKLQVVSEIFLSQGEAYFELARRKHHHHAICELCGRVEDVPEIHHGKIDEMAKIASGFSVINRHSLEFFGTCKKCFIK